MAPADRSQSRRLLAVAWLALLVLAACRSPQPPNLLFVVVDTLRAQELGLYGYPRSTSPFLERFAAGGFVFERHRSQSGCTFPSMNSILTSRYPQRFVGAPTGMAIPEDLPYLPRILQEHGFATAAVSASPIVRATPSKYNRQGGFGAGFESFDENCLHQAADCVNRQARNRLESLKEPFFLYLHYMDPHRPYRPPPSHRRRFALPRPARDWVRNGALNPLKRMLYGGGPDVELTAAERRYIVDAYDEEVYYFDTRFEALMAWLEDRGLRQRTLVVLLADHGEELLDHEELAHCRDLAFDTLLRTPLLLDIPGAGHGRRAALTRNLDVLPTVLDYLGIDPARYRFAGRSLRPVIEGRDVLARYQFAAQGTSRVVTDGRWKLLLDLRTDRARLFDLRDDPGEQVDLAAERSAEREALLAVLGRWRRAVEPGSDAAAVRAAEEVQARLRALGYL